MVANYLIALKIKGLYLERKAAVERARRKFTCKLHCEREQVQAHRVWLKVKT